MRKKYQKRAVSLKCTQAIIFARVSSKRQKDESIHLDIFKALAGFKIYHCLMRGIK